MHGARVEERSADGKTALMIAAANGHDDAVAALLDLGADMESKDANGALVALGHQTPTLARCSRSCINAGEAALSHAAKHKHRMTVALLLQRGACMEPGNDYYGLRWANLNPAKTAPS